MAKVSAKSGKQAEVQSSMSKVASVPLIATPEHNGQSASIDDIRLAAYLKWEAAGKPNCDGTTFWLEAEQAGQMAQ